MGEISEEALDMARSLYAQYEHADNGNDEVALASAFQALMDHIEKVEAFADKQNHALKELVERWEQAKRKYEAGVAVVLGFKERAEKAERQLEAEREWFACSQRGLAEANARLADLVRGVREWISAECDCDSCVYRREFLAKYEQPTEVQP